MAPAAIRSLITSLFRAYGEAPPTRSSPGIVHEGNVGMAITENGTRAAVVQERRDRDRHGGGGGTPVGTRSATVTTFFRAGRVGQSLGMRGLLTSSYVACENHPADQLLAARERGIVVGSYRGQPGMTARDITQSDPEPARSAHACLICHSVTVIDDAVGYQGVIVPNTMGNNVIGVVFTLRVASKSHTARGYAILSIATSSLHVINLNTDGLSIFVVGYSVI